MRKQFELSDPNSCTNKANNNEMMFTLLGRDPAAPGAIRFWCQMRILLGKNKLEDEQIQGALSAALIMEKER